MPDVVPMLSYENGVMALEWLGLAFGFQETQRMVDQEGLLTHGEMMAGDSPIMLATPTPDYESPKHHRQVCEHAARWSEVPYVIDGILVYVSDIDAHFARAREAGATILSELEDGYPGRRYRAEDLEGHRWMFIQRDS